MAMVMTWSLGMITARAQEGMRFENKKLESIVTALDDINARKDIDRLTKKVYVSKDNSGTVNAAGIQLFDKQLINSMDAHNKIICGFVERYLLELLVNQMPGTYKKLIEDRVKIFPNADSDNMQRDMIVKALNGCDNDTGMEIEYHGSKGKVTLTNSNEEELLKMEFPMSYELMTGMTKMEAENALYDNLMYFCANHNGDTVKNEVEEKGLMNYKENIMKTTDNRLDDKDMYGTKYYRKKGKKLMPLYDGKFPLESVFTLMNGAYDNTDVTAIITVNMYGYKKKKFEIPLKYLTDFFEYNGCELYTGINKADNGMIEGAMVACNRFMNYNHIIVFELNTNIFLNKNNNRINIMLYGYIPTHNVNLL